MLKETYLANLKRVPQGAKTIKVARPSILGPSRKLLSDWKTGKISWAEYETQYRKQILSNPEALKCIKNIRELSNREDVYIYCYEKKPPCHRFILMEVIENELK